MSLNGTAFVSIWHGIKSGAERDYLFWHTYEHMPERLGVPGFLRGRRFVNWDIAPHPTFTLYEGAHIETFRSPSYLARLNAPTAWSNKVQPTMTDFLRGGCETLLTIGNGIGGAVLTFRLAGGKGSDFEDGLTAAALSLSRIDGVTGVHVGRHAARVTSAPTAESELRPASAAIGFDHVVLAEGLGIQILSQRRQDIESRLAAVGPNTIESGLYALDFLLPTPR